MSNAIVSRIVLSCTLKNTLVDIFMHLTSSNQDTIALLNLSEWHIEKDNTMPFISTSVVHHLGLHRIVRYYIVKTLQVQNR